MINTTIMSIWNQYMVWFNGLPMFGKFLYLGGMLAVVLGLIRVLES